MRRQRAGWEAVARTEAEDSRRQNQALQERFAEMYNHQGAKVQTLENMLTNAEARDRSRQEDMAKLSSESSQYVSMLRSSEAGTYEEAKTLYRHNEMCRNEIAAYAQQAAGARALAQEVSARASCEGIHEGFAR